MWITRGLVAGTITLSVAVLGAGCEAAPEGGPVAHSDSTSPPSSPALPAGSPSPPSTAAEHVVDNPRSTLQQVALGAGGVRAAVWRRGHHYAVALSGDGFETRVVPDLPTRRPLDVLEAGPARFVVRQGYRPGWVLAADGGLTEVERVTGRQPATTAEVVTMSGNHVVAVDPGTGSAHRIPAPEPLSDLSVVRGTIRGIPYTPDGASRYVASRDGGDTWTSTALPARHALWMPVEGRGEPAFVQGADGATLFPFDALWRQGAAGFSRISAPDDPKAYVSCAHRLPDGRLFLCVDAWSDQRRSKAVTLPGCWVSTDSTWSDFERVQPGPPFADDDVFQPVVLASRDTRRGLMMVVRDPESGDAFVTRDLGRTFTPMAVR